MKILAKIALGKIFRQPLPRLGSMSLNAYRSAASFRSTSEIEQALAAQHLKNDPEYITAQLNEGKITLDHVDQKLIENVEIRQIGLQIDGLGLQLIPTHLQTSNDVLMAVQSNGLALQFAKPEFARDKNILLTAVKENGLALEFVDKSLIKDDPELYSQLVSEAIKNSQSAYKFAPEDVLNNIRDEFISKVFDENVEDTYEYDINGDKNCCGIMLEKANELIRKMPICKYDPSELYKHMIQYFDHDRIINFLDDDTEEKLKEILDISQECSLKNHIDILKENYEHEGDYNFILRERRDLSR